MYYFHGRYKNCICIADADDLDFSPDSLDLIGDCAQDGVTVAYTGLSARVETRKEARGQEIVQEC